MGTYSVWEMRQYLIREQGYDEEAVKKFSPEELLDLYEMYHED